MSALRFVAGWLIGVLFAVGAGTASAPAVEIKDLGAQRLTMGRAGTDIRDSAGQLCDLLSILRGLSVDAPACPETPVGGHTAMPPDLSLSEVLLGELSAPIGVRILAFQQLVEAFCESDPAVGSDLTRLTECWKGIPDRVEKLRLASEELYELAGQAVSSTTDDASVVAASDGQKALVAIGELGRAWAKQQFSREPDEQDVERQVSCGAGRTLSTIAPEITKAFQDLADVRMGEKLRRARTYFDDVGPQIIRAADVLAGDVSPEALDTLCELAAAVDKRTNRRFQEFILAPSEAGDKSKAAQTIADWRATLCRSREGTDLHICTPDGGDEVATFANYLRATLHSWEEAKDAIAILLSGLTQAELDQRIAQNNAAILALVKGRSGEHDLPVLSLSMVLANILADRIDATARAAAPAPSPRPDAVAVDLDLRTSFGKLALRLTEMAGTSNDGAACPTLNLLGLFDELASLPAELKVRLETLDDATSDPERQKLIEQLDAFLEGAIPATLGASIGEAATELRKLGDRISLADLSDSGSGLILAAVLQSVCQTVDGGVEIRIALSLDPKVRSPPGAANSPNGIDSSLALSLPLRRTFAIEFGIDEFGEDLLSGNLLANMLKELRERVAQEQFTVDIAGLCALSVSLRTTAQDCRWPTALSLPAGATLTFDNATDTVTLVLPTWLIEVVPVGCGSIIVISKQVDPDTILDCLKGGLTEHVEALAAEADIALNAAVSKALPELEARASAALEQLIPFELRSLQEDSPLFAECLPTIAVRFAEGAGLSQDEVADEIRRRVALVSRPYAQDDGEARRFNAPAELPLIELSARLSMDECLGKMTVDDNAGNRRLLGEWQGIAVAWSSVLLVTLPEIEGLAGSGDPLAVLDEAFENLTGAAGDVSARWEDKSSLVTGDPARAAFASTLQLSQHFELCKTAEAAEELRFWMTPLTALDRKQLPCATRESSVPIVVARGSSFQSLKLALDGDQAVATLMGRLDGELTVVADGKTFGSDPQPAAEAGACAADAISAENRISFRIENAEFAIGEPVVLGDLLVVTGWQSGREPVVAIVSDQPIKAINEMIETVSPAAARSARAYGLSVKAGALRPCIINGADVLVLAADIGADFIEGLLSEETRAQLAEAVSTAEAVNAVLAFIRAGQPSEPTDGIDLYENARNAANFGLNLKQCKTPEDGSYYYRCDYAFSFLNCSADFTIVRPMLTGGRVEIGGDDVRLRGDCVPTVLDRLFSGDGVDLPVTIADLTVVIEDSARIAGEIRARGKVFGVAANACAGAIEGMAVEFSVGLDGAASFDDSGVDALKKCALSHAAAAFADEVLPPNFDAKQLTDRIGVLTKEWLAEASNAMGALCPEPVNAGWMKVTCETSNLTDARGEGTWNRTVDGWCKLVVEPVASVADASLDSLIAACANTLSVECPADPICDTVVGGKFGVEIRSPSDDLLGSASATFALPNTLTMEGNCNGPRISKTVGLLELDAAFTCKDETIALAGTLTLSETLMGFLGGTTVPPAPMSLSYNLRTRQIDVDVKALNWRAVLSAEATKQIQGQTIDLLGVVLRAGPVTIDENDELAVGGTVIIDWVERVEVPGARVTFDLRRGGEPSIDIDKNAVSAAVTSILNRYASSVSIPGAVEIKNIGVQMGSVLPESVSADVSIEGGMFKATLPRLQFDKRGVRFEDPFKVSLEFDTEILITPISLSGIRGTISEQYLSLGANATLAQAALSYVLMAKGDFTLPFDFDEDIVAVESMHAFRVVPLGQSISRINVNKKLLSRTIDIGGALKPIIWLFGEGKISPDGIEGDMKFAVFETDLATADLDVDFSSGLVTANGNADIGIGELAFIFNGKQFALNPRLELTGAIDIGKFNLSSFRILARLDSASAKFRVLGVSLGLVVPSIKDITSDMLEDLIERLLSFDLEDLGKALEAILSGNLTINPFSGFGADDGDGVAEGSNGDGGEGAEGAYPAASEALDGQAQQGESPTQQQSEDAQEAAQQTTTALAEKTDVPGGSKPLINPAGPYSMLFQLLEGGAVTGTMAQAGDTDVAPLISMIDGPGPHFSGGVGPLVIGPTPIMLEDGLFVAAQPSAALFLPYADTTPTTGCPSVGAAGQAPTTTEVDLLLFGDGTSAAHPRVLPAGLLGLCLEGFDEMSDERKDVLEAGLRVASIVLPEEAVTAEAPLKASWFDCTVDNQPLSGLSMRFTGEIFSRVVLKEATGIRQYRVVGFPYGQQDKVDSLCRLLAQAEPADENTPIDFIDIPGITAARLSKGEMKLDESCGAAPAEAGIAEQAAAVEAASAAQCEKEEWIPLDPEDDWEWGRPPVPRPIEEELKTELDRQTQRLLAEAMQARDSESGIGNGDSVCVVNKDNEPWLAVRSDGAPFMRLPTEPQAIEDVTFNGFGLADCGPVDGANQATFIAYSSALHLPLMGRHARGASGVCAAELFWNEAVHTKRAEILPITPSYCSVPAGAERTFDRDMYLVTRELVLECMFNTLEPAARTACLKVDGNPVSIGGGWSPTGRLVATQWSEPGVVRLWAGPLDAGLTEATVLNGTPQAVKDFVGRQWLPAAVDVFSAWIAEAKPSELFLGPSLAERTSFLSADKALVIDLTTNAAAPTEFSFRAGPQIGLNRELVGELVQQIMPDVPTANIVDVALIGGVPGAWTLALRTDPASDNWELRSPNGTRRTLVGLSDADLGSSLDTALSQLIMTGIDGDIRIARNANLTLLTLGTVTRTSSLVTDVCVGTLLPDSIDEALRGSLIEAWLRDLEHAPLTAACGGQAVRPSSTISEPGSPTIVWYPAGTLATSLAAHVINVDGRTLQLVDRAGEMDSNFDQATRKLIEHAFRQEEVPKVVERLGIVGGDKLRYGFGEEGGDESGLASPQTVCPFKRTELFARRSAVLDAFLVSLGSECNNEGFEDGIVFDDSNGVHSVVAPKGSGLSLHYASATIDQGTVSSATIEAQGVDPADASKLAGLLARAYSEQGIVKQGASIGLVRVCGTGTSSCIFAANSTDDLFVAIDDPSLRAQFWRLGAKGTDTAPFDSLGENKAAAIDLLRGDLTKLAGDASAAVDLSRFCPAKAATSLLWPVVRGGSPAAQKYVQLKAGEAQSDLTLALAGDHSCAQLRDVINTHYEDGVTSILSLNSRATPEVWVGRSAASRQSSYSSSSCPAFLSQVDEMETAAALVARFNDLACVGGLLRVDLFQESATRTILVSLGETPSAWIMVDGGGRRVLLSGPAATLTADHWKMVQLSDFVAEDEPHVTTLARMDTEQERQLLALLPHDGTKTLTLRNASGVKAEIVALGVPDDTTLPVVAAALRAVAEASDSAPTGLVMAAGAATPNFWVVRANGPAKLYWAEKSGWSGRDVELQPNGGVTMQQLLALPEALVAPFTSSDEGERRAVLKLLDGARVAITAKHVVVDSDGALRDVTLSDALGDFVTIDRLVGALIDDPMLCRGACMAGAAVSRFAILQGDKAHLDGGDAGLGTAEIVSAGDEVSIATLETILAAGVSDDVLAAKDGLLFSRGAATGLLVSPAMAEAIVYADGAAGVVRLRDTPAETIRASYPGALAMLEGSLLTRLDGAPHETIGLTRDGSTFIGCGPSVVRVLAAKADWSITGVAPAASQLCGALTQQRLSAGNFLSGTSALIKRDDDFVIFSGIAPKVEVAVWPNGGRAEMRLLTLPFEPGPDGNQLHDAVRELALTCRSVSSVDLERDVLLALGDSSDDWDCAFADDVTVDAPTAFAGITLDNPERWVTGSVSLSDDGAEADLLPAFLSRAALACTTVTHVVASREGRFLTHDKPLCDDRSVLAWDADGEARTLRGSVSDINELLGDADFVDQIQAMPKGDLIVGAVEGGTGLVTYEEGEEQTTLVLYKTPPPRTRINSEVEEKWAQHCKTFAIDLACAEVTARELASAALSNDEPESPIYTIAHGPQSVRVSINPRTFWLGRAGD